LIVTTEHPDFESSPDAYKVKLDAFEGPLQLTQGTVPDINITVLPIAL
jgi:hypothetical protein